MVALREFDLADSMTVTTLMLKTTVTPRAMTSANPCSSPKRRRSGLISDPRAVPQVDGVRELVLVDRASLEAHGEVELERREAAAAGIVRKDGKDVGRRQVVGELDPTRATRGAALPVERIAICVAAHRNRAPADVPAAAGWKLERHGVGREGRHVGRAVDVLADLVEDEPGVQLRSEPTVLLVLGLGACDEHGRDPREDDAHDHHYREHLDEVVTRLSPEAAQSFSHFVLASTSASALRATSSLFLPMPQRCSATRSA